MITSLQSNQVFIFGSNAQGFHGAGSAGQACRGDARNTWRQDTWFLQAMRSPVGSSARIGKWAVFGVARGFQVGREGMSYAICTVTRPGARRSISRADIGWQLADLWQFAAAHPQYEFLLTPIGCGYAGYSSAQMQQTLDWVCAKYGVLPNISGVDCYQSYRQDVSLT